MELKFDKNGANSGRGGSRNRTKCSEYRLSGRSGCPKRPEHAPRAPQERPRASQEPPKTVPRASQEWPGVPSWRPKAAKTLKKWSPRANMSEKAEMQKTFKKTNEKLRFFLRIQRVWTPSKTRPEAIKIRVWRLRCAKSGPSRASASKKSRKKIKKKRKFARTVALKSSGAFAQKCKPAATDDPGGGPPPPTSI